MLETRAAKILRSLLLEIPDIDEQTLHDTVEGEADLKPAIHGVLKAIIEDEMLVTGLEATITIMTARKMRLEERIEMRRYAILGAMQAGEIQRLTFPEATVSTTTKAQSLIISNESQLPSKYLEPQPPKVLKRALKAALAGGEVIEGASLSNGGIGLTVRRA